MGFDMVTAKLVIVINRVVVSYKLNNKTSAISRNRETIANPANPLHEISSNCIHKPLKISY